MNLHIHPEKCQFIQREIKYLGYVISGEGIATDLEKVSAIADMNVREVCRLLGMASGYIRFIPDFAAITQPLTNLKKDFISTFPVD